MRSAWIVFSFHIGAAGGRPAPPERRGPQGLPTPAPGDGEGGREAAGQERVRIMITEGLTATSG